MKDQAQLVIIGAGIVGCSAAYHLARLGWSDILVLDAGPLPRTGGSTSHSPGVVFATHPSRMMAGFAHDTIELLSELRFEDEPCFYPVGGLEFAYTPERWQDLHRKAGLAKAWGIEARLLSPQEARHLSPLLDESRIRGALYTPGDGAARPVAACAAMSEFARSKGITFQGEAEVEAIEVRNGRIVAVVTRQARIRCETVLCAAGIWGPLLGGMVGVPVPLQPCQHLYVETEPLAELAGEARGTSHPVVRHPDGGLYLRQQGERYGIGTYRHEPLLVPPDAIRKHRDARGQPARMEFTPQHFEAARSALQEVYPALARARIAESFNGLFSFTPDGFPLLGEAREVRGFWMAEPVWIAHAGGVGRAVAHWMAEGDPGMDVHAADLNRFHRHHTTRAYVRRRGLQQYKEIYDIIHPLQQADEPRGLRRTPFHSHFETMGAVFFESGGWERPQWLESNAGLLDQRSPRSRDAWGARSWSPIQGAEHRHVREHVALFDLTSFAKFEVQGPAALPFLQRLASNDLDRPAGSITHTLMLNRRGGIVCDLTVTRLAQARFLILAMDIQGMHALSWITRHAPVDGSVQITDVSTSLCALGLWGPKARAVLESVAADDDVSERGFDYWSAKEITIGYVPALALRFSQAGEPGFEIYAPVECGLELWDRIWQAGQGQQMIAAGWGAFDSLRLEKGRRQWGAEIDADRNPIEAGLEEAVKPDKGEFIGRAGLERLRQEGPARRLCCMTLDQPALILMGGEPVLSGDEVLGYVTSANFGYSVGKSIAYGYLPAAQAREGQKVEIEYFGRRHPATVSQDPLFDPQGKRLRA